MRRPYLSLREAETSRQLGALGQSEILRPLEALVQRLQLQTRVDRSRLSNLLPFAIYSHFAPFYYLRRVL